LIERWFDRKVDWPIWPIFLLNDHYRLTESFFSKGSFDRKIISTKSYLTESFFLKNRSFFDDFFRFKIKTFDRKFFFRKKNIVKFCLFANFFSHRQTQSKRKSSLITFQPNEFFGQMPFLVKWLSGQTPFRSNDHLL
jgi:hypothetical protein